MKIMRLPSSFAQTKESVTVTLSMIRTQDASRVRVFRNVLCEMTARGTSFNFVYRASVNLNGLEEN